MASGDDNKVASLGLGGYLIGPPVGVPTAPRRLYRSARLQGPMPAGRWWSSAAWQPFSRPMYPHPLAVESGPRGLAVDTPSVSVGIDEQFKSHSILAQFAGDLTIGADGVEFAEALVDDHSDWSVTLLFEAKDGSLWATLAHGSPFVYVRCRQLTPRLHLASSPTVWADLGSTVGVTVNGHPYGAFLPAGAHWTLEQADLAASEDVAYLSVAALPDDRGETLQLFAEVAHNHLSSTLVDWRYDEERSLVHARYDVSLESLDGAARRDTLIALYPHHWRALDDASQNELIDLGYETVRGRMRLLRGTGFATTVRFPGALPLMPTLGNESERLRTLVEQVAEEGDHHLANLIPHAERDMYWTGVSLGRITALVPIAERVGATEESHELVNWLKATIESHFEALTADGLLKQSGFFWWDGLWTTVIGCPGGFGADTELNDHHYQYAYWIRAAAEIARHDPAWIDEQQWGAMVDLLVRDIATYRRDDPRFPFLRNFDLYAGHSWATGIQQYADGANSESSSEAIAAWAAVLLWGELTGDRALRDFAAFLYATEIVAAEEYWFDVHQENFPVGYERAMAGQVWGGKTSYSVWWTDDPEPMRGISFLPLTPTSLYLGQRPEYVRANLGDLRRLRDPWSYWPDILWCYEALADPDRALALLDAADPTYTEGHSESRAHTLSWILDLLELGRVDTDVRADTSCYAVLRSTSTGSYLAFNPANEPREVHFTDGTTLTVPARQVAITRRSR